MGTISATSSSALSSTVSDSKDGEKSTSSSSIHTLIPIPSSSTSSLQGRLTSSTPKTSLEIKESSLKIDPKKIQVIQKLDLSKESAFIFKVLGTGDRFFVTFWDKLAAGNLEVWK